MATFVVSDVVKQNIAAYRLMRQIREELRAAEVPDFPGPGIEYWSARAVAKRMGLTKDQYERLERSLDDVANEGDAKKWVTVDDLVAAAYALEVSPAELLLPTPELDTEPQLVIAVRDAKGEPISRFTMTVLQYALWAVGFIRFPHQTSQRWERGLIRRRPSGSAHRPDDRRKGKYRRHLVAIRTRIVNTNPFSSVKGLRKHSAKDAHLWPYRYSDQKISAAPSSEALVSGADLVTESLNLLELVLTEPNHEESPERWNALSRLLDELSTGVEIHPKPGHP